MRKKQRVGNEAEATKRGKKGIKKREKDTQNSSKEIRAGRKE